MPAYMHGNLATKPQPENQEAQKQTTKQVVVRRRAVPAQEKLMYPLIFIVFLIGASMVVYAQAKIYGMNVDIKKIEKEIAVIHQENTILKQKVDMLSDPTRLEEEARKLGFAPPQPDETAAKAAGTVKATGTGNAQSSKKIKDQP